MGIKGSQWTRIWNHVTQEFQCDRDSVHGPSHWRRVERNALLITTRSGAIQEIVRLFAVLHDSRRDHDGHDTIHGSRAAAYAATLRGKLFDLSDKHFDLLQYACEWHAHGKLSNDPTIGTCWDADRLDLPRVGIRPTPKLMSTEFGRELATHGSLERFIHHAKHKTFRT